MDRSEPTQVAAGEASNTPAAAPHSTPGPVLTTLFALICGALVANLYYAQPLIALVGADVGLSTSIESVIVTVTQIGYALGLVLLVPLGDLVENRRLILLTMAANVLSLVGLALAPGLAGLFGWTFFVGITSVGAQMVIPLVASLAPAAERGRIVGNVMTGLFGGILLARPAASALADFVGWRGVFAISAAVVTVLAVAALKLMPTRVPDPGRGYFRLIGSLGRLFVRERVLRRRALYHAAMFGSFTLFWTAAPLILFADPYNFTPAGVAAFALAGVLGVFAAPVAGHMADRGLVRPGTAIAILTVIVAFVLAIWGDAVLALLVVAAILVDLGCQANLVFGQREIFQLDATIRSRLNAVYMTTFFVGGAFGSAVASPVLEAFGWLGVCVLGAGMPAVALAYFLVAEGGSSGLRSREA